MISPESKAQLHIHTKIGDSLAGIPEIFDTAQMAGTKVIAVTDHDRLIPGVEARKTAIKNNLSLEVIPGVEITSSIMFDHILALFPDDSPRFDKNNMFMGVRQTVDWIHENDGLAILPHPRTSPFFLQHPAELIIFDGIELLNPVNGRSGRNSRVETHYFKLLNGKLAAVGSGDIHFHHDPGWKFQTLFPGTSAKDLVVAIKKRQTTPAVLDLKQTPIPLKDLIYQRVYKAPIYDAYTTGRLGVWTKKLFS